MEFLAINRTDESQITTLVDLIELRSNTQPSDLAYEFIHNLKGDSDKINYRQLALRARAIAGELMAHNLIVGDRAILVYPPGLELIAAYLGCLYAGVIAIPVYPPLNEKQAQKLAYINKDAMPKAYLTCSQLIKRIPHRQTQLAKSQSIIDTEQVKDNQSQFWQYPEIDGNSLAFLQYTSGSTHLPKGVMVSHKNLLHNIDLMYESLEYDKIEHMVSWLPPYHDMGLISGILLPLKKGKSSHLMAPHSFLLSPFLWLSTISKLKTTISGAPNFAYDYCIRKISQQQKKQLDLSGWLTAFNGAEPIKSESLERFYQFFSSTGFKKEYYFPCYGLAESTLIVSGNKSYHLRASLAASKEELKANKIKINPKTEAIKEIVNCGVCYDEVRIVDPETQKACNENCIGEIWVQGDSVCQGYWNKPELTREYFQAVIKDENESGWFLRTGDLGFIHQQELYVTGRIKDLMIFNGQNYYPQDIELVVENSHQLIRQGCSIAFSLSIDASEQLVIVCESSAKTQQDWDMLIHRICQELSTEFELVPYEIVFIKPKSIPKTTSGKVQRQPCKNKLLKGELDILYRWQSPRFSEKENSNVVSIIKNNENGDVKDWIHTWISLHTNQNKAMLSLDKTWIEYGLDSIAVTQLVHELGEYTGLDLDASVMWEYSNPQEFVEFLNNKILNNHEIKKSYAYQLSPGQERIWFVQQLALQQPLFNIGCAYKLEVDERIDFLLLKQACDAVIEKHEVLRTAIEIKDGKPQPIILPKLANSLKLISIDNVKDNELEMKLREETMSRYYLNEGNLIRFAIFYGRKNEYYFLICAHHIVSDGKSLSTIMQEVIHLYEKDRSVNLRHDKQYYNYSHIQRLKTDSKKFNNDLAFWTEQLKQVPTVIPLSFDKPRIPGKPVKLKQHQADFSVLQTEQINVYCRKNKITPFIFFISAYQLLLTHYSRKKDVVIGVPVSDRSQSSLKDAVGFFVNTIPLRLKVKESETFVELAIKNQKLANSCFSKQSVPLATLISKLGIERDVSYEPLFQVFFVMQNNVMTEISSRNIKGSAIWSESGQLPYDLTLEVIPRVVNEQECYQFLFKYNANLFNLETIKALTLQYKNLITEIMDNEFGFALQLPILSQQEKYKILFEWNQTQKQYHQPKTIHELFEEQARNNPESIAIIVDETKVTYRELNEKSNQLAHYLLEKTTNKNGIIAVSKKRSFELVICFIAILKSGSAYVYIDPEFPEANKKLILEDCKPLLLIEDNDLYYLDKPIINPDLTIQPSALAYVVYTSGTTGKPKGVMVKHGQFADRLHWYMNTDINVDAMLHLFSFSFDGGIAALWWPLVKGGTVVLYRDLKESIIDKRFKNSITTLHLTPSLMKGILINADEFESLSDIVIAGESFTIDLLNEIKSAFANKTINIWNLYGVSECSVISCGYLLNGKETNSIPIGKPISNTECYILDERQQIVPIGVPGELYIGGISVSSGYLNKPDLTQEKFIELELLNQVKTTAYRTGDIARWNCNGDIEYICRNDRQIKLRGYRIELDNIESVIGDYPSIDNAVVLIDGNQASKKQLIAFVSKKSDKEFLLEDLIDYVNNRLPNYMIPDEWAVLDGFPLTSNGKIDSARLVKSMNHNYNKKIEFPTNEIEELLLMIYSDTLKIEPHMISISDDFFQLGGDSILSIHLVMLCNQKGLDVNINDVYKLKTVKQLSRYLTQNILNEGIKDNVINSVDSISNTSQCKVNVQPRQFSLADQGRIIATNHLHWWNFFRVYSPLMQALGTKDKPYIISASSARILNPLSRLFFQPLYVNRNSAQSSQEVMEQCVNLLKNGKTIILSPEGKRNNNRLIQAKHGVSFMAIQSQKPIVPIAIYKKKEKGYLFNRNQWQIVIGNPIKDHPQTLNKMSLDSLTEKLMTSIALLLPAKIRGYYTKTKQ